MVFNSIDFFIFLPTVLVLYRFFLYYSRRLSLTFLLISSYLFYGYIDYRFVGLLVLSSTIDYFTAIKVEAAETQKTRKRFLLVSLFSNLGILAYFKYFDFFKTSIMTVLSLESSSDYYTASTIIPVGLSFYTLQTLSYTFDVYSKKIKPEKDPLIFFSYVAFFPQLVAGPIVKAQDLIPQLKLNRNYLCRNYRKAFSLILWGTYKKVVVADNLAKYVELTFNTDSVQSGANILLSLLLCMIQIYCDFSGYSEIARGVAELFGFNLRVNFKKPLFSQNIQEFWKRWHISITEWFRDYVYFGLGGGRKGSRLFNLLFTCFLLGLWHGASLNFIIWGVLNGVTLVAFSLFRRFTKFKIPKTIGVILTFLTVAINGVFFRVQSFENAVNSISNIFSKTILSPPREVGMVLIILTAYFFFVEWRNRTLEYYKFYIFEWYLILFLIFLYGVFDQSYYYFRF
jgi:alginate O-acetyltransferase complex protein AlgI